MWIASITAISTSYLEFNCSRGLLKDVRAVKGRQLVKLSGLSYSLCYGSVGLELREHKPTKTCPAL